MSAGRVYDLYSHKICSHAALSFTFFVFQQQHSISHGPCSMKTLCKNGKPHFFLLNVKFATLRPTLPLFTSGMTYYPPKSWAVLIPTTLLSAFVAAPLLYAACNILATPRVDSIDTIWDVHSREPLSSSASSVIDSRSVEPRGYVREKRPVS